MQYLRTVSWIVVTALLVAFISINWDKAPVNLWPLEDSNYVHFRWPVGFIALIFFLLGFVPMWFINRTNTWRLNRRITALENSIRITASADQPSTETPPIEDKTKPEGSNEP
jgi:lipopolysaccharide assembly protein A